jgi:hypothetical protein
LKSIAKNKFVLLKPGDKADDGTVVKIRVADGRITRNHMRENPYTGEKKLFSPIRVFTTPAIEYAERYISKKDMQDGFCILL